MRSVARSVVLAGLATGCVPSLTDEPWRVDEAQIIALRSTPAEARPGDAVTWEGLVASPDGPTAPLLTFSQCTRPRTAGERTAVSARCLAGRSLEPTTNPGQLLVDACARFGPNTPPTEGDEPPQRPADADASGGYFVPIHAEGPELSPVFGATRVRCDLVGATRAVFEAFEERYRDNLDPDVQSLAVEGEPRAGETVVLRLELGPDAAEPYVRYDEARARLEDRTESLTVRWYVTDGVLARGRQTLEADELSSPAPFATDWTLPDDPSPLHAWAVVTDDRGGTGWATVSVSAR